MKKLILFLTLLCLFAVGQNIAEAADGRRTGMGYISWDDKTWQRAAGSTRVRIIMRKLPRAVPGWIICVLR